MKLNKTLMPAEKIDKAILNIRGVNLEWTAFNFYLRPLWTQNQTLKKQRGKSGN